MSLRVSARIRVERTAAATWEVWVDGTSRASFGSPEEAERYAFGVISSAAVTDRGLATKAAVAEVQIITATSFGGTDSFAVKDALTGNETVPFVRGTNAQASDLQTALRVLTGDAGLTVAGTTDAGPYTVTWVTDALNRKHLLEQGTVSGCTIAVTESVKGGVG